MNKDKIKAIKEGLLEVARWALLFVVGWIITSTLAQLDVVPETGTVRVWLFQYVIPIRFLINLGLTMLGRFVDKALHEFGKDRGNTGYLGTKGLTGF